MSHREAERWKPAFKVQLKGARTAGLMRAARPWMDERCGGRIDAIRASLQAGRRPAYGGGRAASWRAGARRSKRWGQL